MNERPLTLLDARSLLGSYASNFDSALNQALERIYDEGTWPGLTLEVTLTSYVDADGILTLPYIYDSIMAVQMDQRPLYIVPLAIEYSSGGPGGRDAATGPGVLVDLGHQPVEVAGEYTKLRRQYKVLPILESATVLTGVVKRKFQYLTSEDELIYPAHIGALKNALLAVNFEDQSDLERAQAYWAKCFDLLNRGASQTKLGVHTTANFRVFGMGAAKPTGMV